MPRSAPPAVSPAPSRSSPRATARSPSARQTNAHGVGQFSKPPVPLTAEEKALFGAHLGVLPQDVNFTPDFPRSAQLIAGMWNASHPRHVDGVVSVDPVALSYLLRGTGAVHTAGGRTLTSGNAVRLLLSTVYAEIPDPAQQNVYFNQAARSVFDAVAGGAGAPRTVLENVGRAASERRLLAWSSRPAEQRLIAPTAMGGGLVTTASKAARRSGCTSTPPDPPSSTTTSTTRPRCAPSAVRPPPAPVGDGAAALPGAAPVASLPSSVAPHVSLVQFGRGTILSTLYFLAPVDGSSQTLTIDGKHQKVTQQSLDGRRVLATSVSIKPGHSRTVRVDMASGPGQTGHAGPTRHSGRAKDRGRRRRRSRLLTACRSSACSGRHALKFPISSKDTVWSLTPAEFACASSS